eukprot:CAMPEP_0178968568 /NCGR_PEP_ID=MMETSP0789-20121207/18343_1 /TAXON_ID=3005 /ORGANISM="Rhizosolenia setigera, Strain CCMP 1694" /LENGTH=433 /DNA_ID=CAMNT_0020654545 /DNA_START=675 /DNA_END=1973 /DNA_ORIENTATION=-
MTNESLASSTSMTNSNGALYHGRKSILPSQEYNDEEPAMIPETVWIPSNDILLLTAFLTFLIFAVTQGFAAIIAKSQAMLGDSTAMCVDAMTYGFNLFAERRKQYTDRKTKLLLELIPPLISVTTLNIVTFFILKDALLSLASTSKADGEDDDEPNLHLMMFFSCLNLLLDMLNVGCFARAKHLLGYITIQDKDIDEKLVHFSDYDEFCDAYQSFENLDSENNKIDTKESTALLNDIQQNYSTVEKIERESSKKSRMSLKQVLSNMNPLLKKKKKEQKHSDMHNGIESASSSISVSSDEDEEEEEKSIPRGNTVSNDPSHVVDENKYEHDDDEDSANLNMCSAYTHVFADTLRSIAVIVAASIAFMVDSVDPQQADAVAAILVSIIIVIGLVPLFNGIIYTWSELREVCEEECIANKRMSGVVNTDGDVVLVV